MSLFWTRIPFLPIWPERVDLDGVAVLLRDTPLSARSRRRLLRGQYETAERELVKLFIRPGDQVLELGASIGVVTCFIAQAATPSGRVVSVEAHARLQPYFNRQLEANHLRAEWVCALGCPLWTATVPAELERMSFLPHESNLSGRVVKGPFPGEQNRWLTAEAICAQARLQPTAVVIDIEGAERIWLSHSPRFPVSVRVVIAEFHPHLIGAIDAGRAIQAIAGEGFEIAALCGSVLAFQREQSGAELP